MRSASSVISARHASEAPSPARSTAFWTERRLPMPMSTIATDAIAGLERSLRGGHGRDPRVEPRGLGERLGERLEGDLDDVVKVFTFVQAKVQVAERRARKGFEKDRSELDVPRAKLRFRQRDLPHE